MIPLTRAEKIAFAAIVLAGAVVTLGFNYLLALAGEPRALWFFRDVLGVM